MRVTNGKPGKGFRNLKNGSQGGFTLLELAVVVAILAILAGIAIPKLMDRPDEARVMAAEIDIRQIQSALKLYRLDNGRYPTTQQGISALVEKPEIEPTPTNWKSYMEEVPSDPWGQPYLYLSPGNHGDFDLYSKMGNLSSENEENWVRNWKLSR
ncbi:MAG: type II secretion system major pseudopilin GspG [Methyloprofundus sp.]|nr:type II secretion system major pseudopilin GspG [Methyloprofundus sp.]